MRPMKRISVLLADDYALFRKALRKLLKDAEDIEVVSEAKNGREAVELTRQLHPAVVLMDIAMPLLNGLAGTFERGVDGVLDALGRSAGEFDEFIDFVFHKYWCLVLPSAAGLRLGALLLYLP